MEKKNYDEYNARGSSSMAGTWFRALQPFQNIFCDSAIINLSAEVGNFYWKQKKTKTKINTITDNTISSDSLLQKLTLSYFNNTTSTIVLAPLNWPSLRLEEN